MLEHLVLVRSPTIKPGISIDLSRMRLLRLRSEQCLERITLAIQFVSRKPAVRHAWRSQKPSPPFPSMAHQHGVVSIALDQTNGRRSPTNFEQSGDAADARRTDRLSRRLSFRRGRRAAE
jgi:hypothetical protein